MLTLENKESFQPEIKDLMISAEKVAHVQLGNTLEHALLVLTKSGYSAIPVLDPKYKLHGLISSSLITDSLLGIERIEFELLEKKKVEDAMKIDIATVTLQTKFVKALSLVVDHPFLCVVDQEQNFEGILTRRSVLKVLNRFVHTGEFK
ncbi:CBS domain-containing protein YkuL [Bacillus coahuilensis p1.1.43]|uniref:CBS domain-containing protein YkuL n=1 Tax=Bacillus coahuilensis p1.1.43 TaxID=1150625 RepID=A0A147KAB7_9BACI|nr:cyclic-di-AMP-binding protein CbpB [Bacillus coahuilensis]KUP07627.1 CBS domain-containing protein YkuL [Bacillus coahuilensis p1.1.43]